MRKNYPLYKYLTQKQERITLGYSEIEDIISARLPTSAYKYTAWWDNNSHVQSISWRKAGYSVDRVLLGESVTFIKNRDTSTK